VDFIEKINAFALENYLPDCTIFIDLTPEAAFKRKHGADENDRMEQAGLAFHKKVYQGYKAMQEKYPSRIVAVNGEQSPQEIFNQTLSVLKERGIL
jgi:dTMP kinase